jgi:hypothetical protein
LQLSWAHRSRDPKPVETGLTKQEKVVVNGAGAAGYGARFINDTYSLYSQLMLKDGEIFVYSLTHLKYYWF